MPLIRPFDKRNRNAGTYEFEFPWPQNVHTAHISAILDQADLIDTTLTIAWELVGSYDDGQTWVEILPLRGWHGGLDGEGAPQTGPNLWYSSSGNPPTHGRFTITLSKRVSVGFDIDIN